MDTFRGLWKELFREMGKDINFSNDYGDEWGIFCGTDTHKTTKHSPECVYIRAKKLLEQENNEQTTN